MDRTYRKKQRQAVRHEQKRQQLGSPNPACASCGCMNVVTITDMPLSQLPEAIQQKLVEKHHLAGRKAGDWQVHACLNCHAVFSDNQYDWDERLLQPKTWTQRLAAFLQGLAEWLRETAEHFRNVADALQEWIDELLLINPEGLEKR